MRTFLTALFFCSVFFLRPNQAEAQRVQKLTIPMDLTTRRPIVELLINGKGPYKFIFDTGSMTHVIDEKLSAELGLKVVGEDGLRTPGSKNRVVSKRVAAPKVGFSRTNLLKDVEMNTINLRSMLPVDGVLSAKYFEDFLLTMDYPNSVLEVSAGSLTKTDAGVITFLQKPRVVNVNLDVSGNSVEVHLDTGSPGGISLPYALKDKLKLKSKPKRGHTINTPVASFKRWDVELVGNITLGNVTFKNPRVALVEGFEMANLGYEVIKNLRTTIDRKNNLMKFEEPVSQTVKKRSTMKREMIYTTSYAGTYEGGRKIFQNDSGDWMYKNAAAPVSLELVQLKDDLYQMKVPDGLRAPMEIPKVQFIRNDQKMITSLKFIYKEREDGPFKKIEN
mgnify:CR=1 FL=1